EGDTGANQGVCPSAAGNCGDAVASSRGDKHVVAAVAGDMQRASQVVIARGAGGNVLDPGELGRAASGPGSRAGGKLDRDIRSVSDAAVDIGAGPSVDRASTVEDVVAPATGERFRRR